MKFILIIIPFFILIMSVPLSKTLAISSITDIEVWTKVNSADPLLVVDVRSNQQYIEGHIPIAVNFPLQNDVTQSVVDTIRDYNKSAIITVCSCEEGGNAEVFTKKLEGFGLNNVFYMYDNFLYWPYDIVPVGEPGIISKSVPTQPNKDKSPGLGGEMTPLLVINISIFGLLGYLFLIRPKLKK